jgi:hypothetical protein
MYIPISNKGSEKFDRVMMFNAALDNISVIWWWSVLLVVETGVTTVYQEKTNNLQQVSLYLSVTHVEQPWVGCDYGL